MLAVCVPWLPGSSRLAPSDVMVMPPFGWVPLALNWPIGPLLLCVVKLFHMLWLSPPVIPMPGMIFINSAASRPTIERFSIMFLFSVWLACPSHDPEGRRCLRPEGNLQNQGVASTNCHDTSPAIEDEATRRSIHLRSRGDQIGR